MTFRGPEPCAVSVLDCWGSSRGTLQARPPLAHEIEPHRALPRVPGSLSGPLSCSLFTTCHDDDFLGDVSRLEFKIDQDLKVRSYCLHLVVVRVSQLTHHTNTAHSTEYMARFPASQNRFMLRASGRTSQKTSAP